MITVVPARVTYDAGSQGVLQTIQRDIARASEHEHIPLSRIQKWIPESKGALFDTLFSVSFKERDASGLWTVVESQNPEPDVSDSIVGCARNMCSIRNMQCSIFLLLRSCSILRRTGPWSMLRTLLQISRLKWSMAFSGISRIRLCGWLKANPEAL